MDGGRKEGNDVIIETEGGLTAVVGNNYNFVVRVHAAPLSVFSTYFFLGCSSTPECDWTLSCDHALDNAS